MSIASTIKPTWQIYVEDLYDIANQPLGDKRQCLEVMDKVFKNAMKMASSEALHKAVDRLAYSKEGSIIETETGLLQSIIHIVLNTDSQ
jgi:hypothetical protein